MQIMTKQLTEELASDWSKKSQLNEQRLVRESGKSTASAGKATKDNATTSMINDQ